MQGDGDQKDMEFEYKKVDKRIEQEKPDDAEAAEPEAPESEEEPVAADAGEPQMTDEDAAAATEAEADVVEEATTDADAEGDAESEPLDMSSLDVYQVLRIFIGMLSEQAWVSLGLHVRPGASDTEVRLTEARIAIDTLKFVSAQLADNLQDAEKRELDTLITTLQMNYVQKS